MNVMPAMASIKRYLADRHSAESDEALRRLVAILLQTIELHAIQGDEFEWQQFRSSIHEIGSSFNDETPPDEMLVIAGKVASTLKTYGERTTRYLRAHKAEYECMVSTLMNTIAVVTRGGDCTIARLRDIERQLRRASDIEDVRILRKELTTCLETIEDGIEQREGTNTNNSDTLQAMLQTSQPRLQQGSFSAAGLNEAVMDIDAVTGLPGPAAAEMALIAAADNRSQNYLVVVVADRVHAVNANFGYAVGDHVLRKVREHLQAKLSAEDCLFRWRGPSFIVLLNRPGDINDVTVEITRIVSFRAEELIDIGTRSILLPISCNWSVLPIENPTRLLTARIDQFVTQGPPKE